MLVCVHVQCMCTRTYIVIAQNYKSSGQMLVVINIPTQWCDIAHNITVGLGIGSTGIPQQKLWSHPV